MPAGIVRPNSDIQPIVGIQFGIFSPDEIERRSVVEITNAGTYDGNEPRIGGLFDPRMGVLDNGKTCRSCGQTNHSCPGHFGHFKLARPVYFIQFFGTILNVLNCVCVRCSKLLIDKELHKDLGRRRGEGKWRAVLNKCSTISRCGQETEDGCGARQPDRYVREGIARIVAEWDEMEGPGAGGTAEGGTKQRQYLEVEFILRLFRRITDEDVDFIGLNRFWCRPDWMICSVMPIPPPQVRPSVIQDNNQRSEDDLTHKLFEIIMTNQRLQDKINNNSGKNLIEDEHTVLQYHVATLVDNQIPGVAPSAQRSGRPLKSVQQRLGSKEGRIRYNIQGKRVEFSARSVITPDPNISIGELGVPMKIAMNLTFPEKVTPFNKDLMYKLVQNGADKYPGAKTIVRVKGGRMISLKHINTKEIVLHIGDVVNRHLADGDMVLFNRQPTLHRMSMMGHRVRVLPYNTFRLNVSVTSPYNADFDGDEMNAHIPQSYEAACELSEIAAVPHQIVTPRHAKPVIGVVQDSLVGSYRLTQPTVHFNRRAFMNMMMWNRRFEGVVPKGKKEVDGKLRWTGQQVLSQLLPPINMEMGNGMYKDDKKQENFVKIREGVIEQGIFDKDIFSKQSKGIVHVTFKDHGSKETVDFIDAMQNTVEQFLVYNGFSVGISDLIADEDTRKQMEEVIKKRKTAIENILLQIHMDLFDNNTGKSNQQEFEDKVFGELNKATEEAGKIGLGSLADENRLVAMVRAGSKGSTINIAQMMACVGQQAPEGRRIPYGFTDRTLPHYKKYDDGAEARGFVESSFIDGLTPQEFFFHAMSGREGLIDTAVKSVTGDTKIVVLEDCVAKCVAIGDWIDAHMRSALKGDVEHFPEENELEMLQLRDNSTYIPSVSSDGKVSWCRIAAVTRHDPGQQLYEVTTLGGRSVIVPESKSLLVWHSDTKTFQQMATPDVRPGHCMPVTMRLAAPPTLCESIPLENYLSKNDYLYGSDFHAAQKAVEEAMVDREHIPSGWWEQKNGKDFTLPYDSKARFIRTLSRSKTDNILTGYVYPFTTNRDHARIPDQFALDANNGRFLGLFLAEGNVDVKSGYVAITNNNSTICQFVHDWFESQRIRTSESVKLNAIGGVTTNVRGYSTVLAKFLDNLVGHGAASKRVPAEAFAASDVFISALLDGYFSGDGTVTTNSVEAGSASKELIEGISMLCTRLGIFAKVFESQLTTNNIGTETILPTYRISIRAQWATLFAQYVTLIDDAKQVKLSALKASVEHRNFPFQNDVVLDEIVDIKPIGLENYTKLYDLTVPETFTFGLANGLQVYDTADTGYIQRQLVKAMEDLVTQYDGSVRDSRMNIVQMHYGEDGTNSTKIESANLGLQKLSEVELLTQYGMADNTTLSAEDAAALDEFAKQVLDDRRMLVEGVQKSKQDTPLYSPVNLERVLNTVSVSFNLTAEPTDLTPAYIIEKINNLIEKTQPYNKLWGALLRFNLAPHKLLGKVRFTQRAFDAACEMILVRNYQSWALPGEQVGIIAAQSIGEPSTQMSCTRNTFVHLSSKGGNEVGEIGTIIDKLLEQNAESVVNIANDSVVLDLKDDYYIVGVSNDEKTSWKRISQVSRHPANGGLVKVVTKSGRTTTATLSHSFLKRSTKGIVPVLGSDLKVGMRIPIGTKVEQVPVSLITTHSGFTLDKEFGWLCGIYLADGCFNGNNVKITKMHPVVEASIRKLASKYDWNVSVNEYTGEYGPGKDTNIYSKELKDFLLGEFNKGSYNKTIGPITYSAPREFQLGLLSGYFDGDGNVSVQRHQIRAGSRSKNLIRHISRLLSYCGFFASFGEETSVRMPDKVMYTIQILKKHAQAFKEKIGFTLEEKAKALDEIITYMARENKHDTKEIYDKIPELGDLIADTGRILDLPGHSRNYGRWTKKESVGRLTLLTYIEEFKAAKSPDQQVLKNIELLEEAAHSDVVWDEITELIYLDDPKEFVYDFTVPGNDSFMVDDAIMVHNTLNTFHLAGVAAKSNVTRGVPRLKELLKVTQNPKAISLTISLKPEYRGSKEKARQVAQDLELTLLKDITVKTAVYFDPSDEESKIVEDRELLAFYKLFEAEAEGTEETDTAEPKQKWSGWLLRLEMDRDRMFRKNISMDDVAYVLRTRFGEALHLVYSDYNNNKLIMRMRLPEMMKSGLDDLTSLKKFQSRILNGIVFRGIPGIKSVTFREDKDLLELKDGSYTQVTQYVLDTDGSNFLQVMNHPYVDATRLSSSHVHDILPALGIEATRAVLLNEITTLFEEAGVNNRHLGLLCDVMTRAGRLMPSDRHGINKTDIGPLAKASFEETEKILLNAALFGEMDPVTGVSSNIMMGQPIRGGTGFFDILLDEVALMRLQDGLPTVEDSDDDGEGVEPTADQINKELFEDENDLCSTARLRMNVAMPNAAVLLEEPDVGYTVLDKEDD
jgi:DNA-directed RNA polymerase beta' subunit